MDKVINFHTITEKIKDLETVTLKIKEPYHIIVNISDPDGSNPRLLSLPFRQYAKMMEVGRNVITDEGFDITIYRLNENRLGYTTTRYPEHEIKL